MFLFRLRERIKHQHVEDCLNQLINMESGFSIEDLRLWQMDHLKALIQDVCNKVPYYQQLDILSKIHFEENHNPYDSLSVFPVVDKKVISRHFNEWFSDDIDNTKIALVRTSGSTGIPFRLYLSPEASWYKAASKYRLYNRFGIMPDDRQMCLSCDKKDEKKSLTLKIKLYFNDRFINKRIFSNVTYLTDNDILNQITKIKKSHVKSVWGYPSAIYEICRWALANNVCINDGGIKAVIFSGEGHTTKMKEVVSTAMGGIPVIDEYNSSESFLAGSCKDGNLHLNEDTTLFEVLTEDGKICEYGRGELLITSLFNKDFPFIRYKIGDIVEISREKCSCGSIYKVLKSVDGRSSAVIYNGKSVIPHTSISHYIHYSEFEKDICRIQIEQNNYESVIVRVEPNGKGLNREKFENMWISIFNKLHVCFEYVDSIPREKSGKFRDVIQNIK